MAKKRVFFVTAAVFVFFALCAVGCGKSELDKYAASVSELREYIYSGSNDLYTVTAISGTREQPYEFDGISNPKRKFTVITVTPKQFQPNKTYSYVVTVDGTKYEGNLMPHPFAQSLSTDIPVISANEFELTVKCDGEQTVKLSSAVTGENIGAAKAFGIALNKLKSELKAYKVKGKINAEIYVRLMENPIDGSGGNFWYVAFVGRDKSTTAVLLKADTGEVAAVRVA